MLFSGVYRSSSEEVLSDGETTSSVTSDITSRTSASDTWYDVRSDIEQQQQPITQFDHTTDANIRLQTNDYDDDNDQELIRSINDMYIDDGTFAEVESMTNIGNDFHDIPIQDNQQQQTPNEWINPYWGVNWLPATTLTGPIIQGNIESSNIQHASSKPGIQRLIPGSILINDRDEIEDSLWKQGNSSVESLTSSNSFHPGGKYISDESGGRGGFLAPTHVQHHAVVTPSDLTEYSTDNFSYKGSNSSSDDSFRIESALHQEQTSSEQDGYDDKQWNDLYWLASDQVHNKHTTYTAMSSAPSILSKFKQKENSFLQEDPAFLFQNTQSETLPSSNEILWTNANWETNVLENPASTIDDTRSTTPSIESWRNDEYQTPTFEKQRNKIWDNSSGKDSEPEDLMSTEQSDDSQEILDSKHYQSQAIASSKHQDKPWVNPYWKDYKPHAVTSSKQQGKPWVNPYWGDNKTSAATQSKKQDIPWQNPYWKNWKPGSSNTSQLYQNVPLVKPNWQNNASQTSTKTKPQAFEVTKQQNKPWVNPYWGSNKTPASVPSKKPNIPWQNPYWKDWKPRSFNTSQLHQNVPLIKPNWQNNASQTSTTTKPQTFEVTKQQNKPWVNPYWGNNKTPASVPSKKPNIPWQNPYWKNWKPGSSNTFQLYQNVPLIKPNWQNNASQTSTTTKPQNFEVTKQQNKPWVNPYWGNNKTPASIPSKKQDIPWQNPYWKNWKPGSFNTSQLYQSIPLIKPNWQNNASQTSTTTKPQNFEVTKQQNKPWVNPYWGNNKTPASVPSKKQDIPWQNPYWKDWKPGSLTTSQKSQNGNLKNHNGHNNIWQTSTTTKQQNFGETKQKDKPWENPYWKNKNVSSAGPTWISNASRKGTCGMVLPNAYITDNVSPPDHRVPPIPSFYKRIFPVNTPLSSIQPSTTTNEKKLQFSKESMHVTPFSIPNETYNNDINGGNDFLPYTIDTQGIAHYRSLPSSSSIAKNKTVHFGTSPSTTQNPVTSKYITDAVPLQRKYTTTPTSFTSNVTSQLPIANTAPSSSTTNSDLLQSLGFLNSSSYSPNNDPSSTKSGAVVITLDELYDIQNALHLLKTNPNAIPTIQTFQQHVPTVYPSDEKVPHQPITSLFTNNNDHRLIQQPPTSSSSSDHQNDQLRSLSNAKSQQLPMVSSSKNYSNPNDILNRFIKPGSINHL
ncbi:unnamed protein product [Rotaria sp. Silwood2]|nr:unnamed protein product [Rotaria sp. Silwood2]